jgi:hypothetical protein
MALRKYKPTSPGRRFFTGRTFEEITKKEPEKSLLTPLKKSAGRNVYGRITARHRGGGHKRKYRIIDFKRDKDTVPARVAGIEYDPNRSANIALLHYADGEKRYILAPLGLQEGDTLVSGPRAEIRPGNAMALSAIPAGTFVHNIELNPGAGGQLARSAGTAAQLAAKEGKYAHLRLPSGEVRQGPAALIIDKLGVDMPVAPKNTEARPLCSALKLAAHTLMTQFTQLITRFYFDHNLHLPAAAKLRPCLLFDGPARQHSGSPCLCRAQADEPSV